MREKHKRGKSGLKNIILDHIYKNIKVYMVIILLFIIGITLGVIFVNNIGETELTEVNEYIMGFVNSLKQDYHIDKVQLLKKSLLDNLLLVLSMWFLGLAVVGIPIVLGILIYRSFCIGYTISAAIAVLGTQKGIMFLFSTIFLHNLIFIPVIIFMTVSCIKLYKSIMKDKRRENIKIEIIRHTIISIILFLLLCISSLIEVYVSTNILMLTIMSI